MARKYVGETTKGGLRILERKVLNDGTKVFTCFCPCCGKESWIKKKEIFYTKGKCHNCYVQRKKRISKEKSSFIIYGIFCEDELYYIGQTTRALQQRISEHKRCVRDPSVKSSQQPFLYEQIRNDLKEGKQISYKPLIGSKEPVSISYINLTEYEYIKVFKPKFNYIGVKKEYVINHTITPSDHEQFLEGCHNYGVYDYRLIYKN